MNRKRQIIDATLDELHEMQLDMIDAAVERSDCREAKELIAWIQKLWQYQPLTVLPLSQYF